MACEGGQRCNVARWRSGLTSAERVRKVEKESMRLILWVRGCREREKKPQEWTLYCRRENVLGATARGCRRIKSRNVSATTLPAALKVKTSTWYATNLNRRRFLALSTDEPWRT